MQRNTRSLLLLAAALALPATAAAQDGTTPAPAAPRSPTPAPAAAPAAPAAAPTQAAPTAAEAAQIRQRLADLQARALQDPTVKAANDAFGAEVMAAMVQLDSGAAAKSARAEAIQAEVAAARTAGDNARLNQLAQEAQTLQAYFAALRPRALALPEIEQKRQAYIAQLFAKMTELDPEAPQLVARLDASRAAGGAGGTTPR